MRREKHPRTSQTLRALLAAGCSIVGLASVQGQTVASWLSPVNGTWTDPTKWSTNPAYPNNTATTSFDAFLTATGSAHSIVLPLGSISLNNLTLDSPDVMLRRTGAGTLNLSGTLDLNAGTLQCEWGTISNATINRDGSGTITFVGGNTSVFDRVKMNFDFNVASSGFAVANQFTMLNQHQLTLTNGQLSASNACVVDGSGSIMLTSSTILANNVPLTLSSAVTVVASDACSVEAWGSGTIMNQGRFIANAPGKLIRFRGNWVNQGTIQLSAGTLDWGGTSTTAGLGTIVQQGGILQFSGTLDNSSSTLTIDDAFGDLRLSTGTINGGTVVTSGSHRLIGAGSLNVSKLIGTVLAKAGTLTIGSGADYSSVHFQIEDNIENNEAYPSDGVLMFASVASLSAGADVRFMDTTRNRGRYIRVAPGSFAIQPGSQIIGGRGGNCYISTTSGSVNLQNAGTISAGEGCVLSAISIGTFGNAGWLCALDGGSLAFSGTSASLVNTGTIIGTTNAKMAVLVSGAGTNSGVIISQSGARIDLGAITNAGTLNAQGGRIGLANGWSNLGVIVANNGTLSLGKPAPSGFGNLIINSSYVFFNGNHTPAELLALNPVNSTFAVGVGGTLDNTGNTVVSEPGVLQWQVGGGTISGGTISGAGFGSVYGNSMLNGSVLATDAFADASTLTLQNVPAFTGRTLTLRNKGAIVFSGTTPLADGNTITFASGSANLVAFSGAASFGPNTQMIASGGSGSISASTFTNMGTMRVLNGGAINLGGYWNNLGTINIDGGTLTLGGVFTPASLGDYTGQSGTISLLGHLDNTGSTFTLDGNKATWVFGGEIKGGVVEGINGARLVIARQTSYAGLLDGVTLRTDVSISGTSLLYVNNGLTLDHSTISVVNAGTPTPPGLRFAGSQTLSGTGTILLNAGTFGAVIRASGEFFTTATLTIGSGITVRAELGYGGVAGGYQDLHYVRNEGTMTAAGQGTLFVYYRANNLGTIEAHPGGVVDLSSSTFTNYSSGTLSGGTWAVYGNSTMNFGTASITTNNANIILDGAGATMTAINTLATNLGRFTITNDRDFTSVGSLTNSGTITIGSKSVLRTSGDLFNTGTVDLAGGIMLVDYPVGSPANANVLLTQLGTTIITSNALLNPALRVGYADNAELGTATFAGQNIDASTMIFMMTFAGDSNLDGVVNTIDFNRLAGNFGASGASWLGSDFDYNHVVDSTDFNLFISGYGQRLPAPAPQLGMIVPEPGSVVLSIATLAILRGRRRARL